MIYPTNTNILSDGQCLKKIFQIDQGGLAKSSMSGVIDGSMKPAQ